MSDKPKILVLLPPAVNVVMGYTQDGKPMVEKLDFAAVVEMALQRYVALGQGARAAELGARLFEKLSKLNGDAEIRFEADEFAAIRGAVETCNYGPAVNRQLVAFHRAIAEAKPDEAVN